MFHHFKIQTGSLSPGCIIEKNIDYRANNKGAMAKVENQEACAKLSFSREGALFWTFQPSTRLCWPKTNKAGRMAMQNVVSGNKECGRGGKFDTPPSHLLHNRKERFETKWGDEYIWIFVKSPQSKGSKGKKQDFMKNKVISHQSSVISHLVSWSGLANLDQIFGKM